MHLLYLSKCVSLMEGIYVFLDSLASQNVKKA
jgi:hypothetical protein